MMSRPFEPSAVTQNASVTGSAASITIARPSDVNTSVHVYVTGTQTVFIRVDGTDPTTSNGIPCPPGSIQTFSIPVGVTTVRHIAAAAGSTIYVTPGRGL